MMTPFRFLAAAGPLLVLVGVLGFFLIGPTPERSVLGSAWWFGTLENWVHIFAGVLALLAAYFFDKDLMRYAVMAGGVAAVLLGLYGLLISERLLGMDLENPADTVLHFVLGIWALASARRPGETA
ncbi:MAG: hypothetical protein UY99_C0010G0013 [Parcubacteria group bacterium GW2011_GWA1_59_11]|nr:MAG: hypothetical protein UY99_C0010G0013 [Parcubacteria group bacterium GW2011_GWA1_59_11]